MLDEFSDIVTEEDARFLAEADRVAKSETSEIGVKKLSCDGCSFQGWYGHECDNCSRSTSLIDKYNPK